MVTCNIKTRQITELKSDKNEKNTRDDNYPQQHEKYLRAKCCGVVGGNPSPQALQVSVVLMAL